MINIIGAIVSGLIIGALARFFYPGAVQMGWIATILLGIGGSLLAASQHRAAAATSAARGASPR
jgi:uncharacterized membrane protein YeaQ/YmgE (transglycosylase-associated protein family)